MKKINVIILVITCCILSDCKNNKDSKSNDSMQPYDGYPLYGSKEEIIQILKDKCVDTINFKKGDVIADIGAGNGSVEAMVSIFHDSLTFYIQDIDTSVCNQKAINEVVNFYQNVNGKPFTNKFIAIKGADNETNLPDDTFDIILMLWTYQYLKNPEGIMSDLRKKLKNDGLMYLINPDHDYESGKQQKLEFGWNASTLEEQISSTIKCGFELIRLTRNYEDPENPYIMVFKKKIPLKKAT
jgi:SAM-dependent methyltransferase